MELNFHPHYCDQLNLENRIKNSVEILIFLIALFNLVPPIFYRGVYFDNIYFSLLYLFLTACGVLLPYVKTVKPIISFISTLLGMWSFSMLIFELYHFNLNHQQVESVIDKELFNKFLITFVFGIGLFRTNLLWQEQEEERE